ncbi:unnamed protein product [Closterium sp. NIES-54]
MCVWGASSNLLSLGGGVVYRGNVLVSAASSSRVDDELDVVGAQAKTVAQADFEEWGSRGVREVWEGGGAADGQGGQEGPRAAGAQEEEAPDGRARKVGCVGAAGGAAGEG